MGIKKTLRNILYGGILLGSLALAGCTFNKNKIDYQEPPKAVYCLNGTKPTENKLEKVVKKKDNTGIPKINLEFGLNYMFGRNKSVDNSKVNLLGGPYFTEKRFLDMHIDAKNVNSVNRLLLKETDILLKKAKADNWYGRLAKFLFLDFGITKNLQIYQHEMGHVYRHNEAGVEADPIIYIFPFSLKNSLVKARRRSIHEIDYLNGTLGTIGGLEAELVGNNRNASMMMLDGKQTYYDALMYCNQKLARISYLSSVNLKEVSDEESVKRFFNGDNNDVYWYYYLDGKTNVKLNSDTVSNGPFVELVDGLFFISLYHNLKHITDGTRQIELPNKMATMNFNLAPFGPEYYLNLFYRNENGILTKVYGRASKGINYGVGIEFKNIPLKSKISDSIGFGVDLWNQRFPKVPLTTKELDSYKELNGFGAGINFKVSKNIGKGINLDYGIRAKTDGYNLGDKLKETIKLYLGVSGKF